jgi:hypothetical protein
VKKEGPNKGRWFYNCPKDRKSKDNCKFFIWESDAQRREEEEPEPEPEPYFNHEPSPTPTTQSTKSTNTTATNKRKYQVLDDSGDEFGGFGLQPGEAAEMEQQASQSMVSPETPRKVIKSFEYATPGRAEQAGPRGLPTPITGGRTVSEGSRDVGVFSTPHSSQEDVEQRAAMGKTGYTITDDVMELLKGKVDAQTLAKVQNICDRFGMKLSGIEKGRDITRVALKQKDETMEGLKKKVADLEAEVEKKKAVIKMLADM